MCLLFGALRSVLEILFHGLDRAFYRFIVQTEFLIEGAHQFRGLDHILPGFLGAHGLARCDQSCSMHGRQLRFRTTAHTYGAEARAVFIAGTKNHFSPIGTRLRVACVQSDRSNAKDRSNEETPVFRPGLFMPPGIRVDCTRRPYRRNSISRMMIGIGIPINQSSAPFPKPISISTVLALITAGEKESS